MQQQEAHILDTWQQNAKPWINAIANNEIESRALVTNAAIVNAVLSLHPKSVWDVGCGEGWLSRAIQQHGITTYGTDAIPELIAAADAKAGYYYTATYQQIIDGSFKPPQKFEAMVFNFSLFGNEIVTDLLQAMRRYLLPDGKLVIQTLHPYTACGIEAYQDGWRTGSWSGFSTDFCNPAPWYFRTLESWMYLLHQLGFRVQNLVEPIHPTTKKPASLILVAGL